MLHSIDNTLKMILNGSLKLTLVLAGGLSAAIAAIAYFGPQAPVLIEHSNDKKAHFSSGNIRYALSQDSVEGQDCLVLLHGFNSQMAVWDEVWAQLDPSLCRIRLDLPGFGGSIWQATSYSLQDQSERVTAFLDSLKVRNVILVGVSMGGSLAAWMAAQHPERVKGLVLLAPSGFTGSLTFGGRLAFLYRSGFLNSIAQRLTATSAYQALFPKSKVLQALSVTSSYGDLWVSSLEKIKAPAWILWSKGDLAVPFEYAEKVSEKIIGSQLIPLEAAIGHDIPRYQPELISEIVRKLETNHSEETHR